VKPVSHTRPNPGRSDVEQLIRRHAADRPSDTWLLWQDETYSWSDVLDAARAVANGLVERGVRPGQRVALMMPNGPEFLWSHFGVVFAGALSVPLNISQRGTTLEYILADSGAVAVIFADDLRDVVTRAARACPDLRELVTVGGVRDAQVRHTLEDLMAAPTDDLDLGEDAARGGVGLMYTSGTTGPPKGVVTKAYDLRSLEALIAEASVRPGETMYTPLPLYHGNALVVSALGSMVAGGRLALGAKFSASRFWDEIRRYDAVEFNALGGIMPILLKQPVRPDDADNPVRVVLSAGAPSDERWDEFQNRFGVRLVEWFGMVDSPGTLLNASGRPGSMGRPVGGVDFRVVDDHDQPLPAGEVGELVFKHPAGQLSYYHNNEAATLDAYRGGWFHSGDLASVDDDGWFYFRGRKKQSMRRRGENISAWEIESVLIQHPAVRECAAYGVPSDLGEEEVVVAVVPVEGADLRPQDVIAFCEGSLAHYAVPRFVTVVAELPKTGTQKIQYEALRQAWAPADAWDRESHAQEARS
jgi:crotonobetaine/carnitine-CoA ligase